MVKGGGERRGNAEPFEEFTLSAYKEEPPSHFIDNNLSLLLSYPILTLNLLTYGVTLICLMPICNTLEKLFKKYKLYSIAIS